jgi:hypothetical protein
MSVLSQPKYKKMDPKKLKKEREELLKSIRLERGIKPFEDRTPA